MVGVANAVVSPTATTTSSWQTVGGLGGSWEPPQYAQQVRKDSSKYSVSSEETSTSVVSFYHAMSDDGAGSFLGDTANGQIDYNGQTFTLKVEDDFESESYKADRASARDASSMTGGYGNTESLSKEKGEWGKLTKTSALAGGAVEVRYRPSGNSPAVKSYAHTPAAIKIELAPLTTDRIVPGSVEFNWLGHTYRDINGAIYRDGTATDPGTLSGQIDYVSGVATMTDYLVDGSNFDVTSLWTSKGDWKTARMYFRTSAAPVKPGGLTVSVLDWQGNQIIATSDAQGRITGDHCEGVIEYVTGNVEVMYGDWMVDADLTAEEKAEYWYDPNHVDAEGRIWRPWPVDPASATYNAVVYQYLPLSKDILGLDPVRLPQDGRVILYRPGDLAMIHHTQRDEYANLSPGQTLDAARVRLASAWLEDSTGTELDPALYTLDLNAGTATLADPLDLSAYSAPFAFLHRIEDLRMVSDVEIGGRITVTRPLSHEFPANESYVSSVILGGDRQARVANVFDQQTWTDEWSDSLIGDPVGDAEANTTTYPIQVTNRGAITERWAFIFTGATTFKVVGETVGQIAVGDTSTQCAPINPNEGVPYFVIDPLMWGEGWATNNVLRVNTIGTEFGTWLVRTVLQGDLSGQRDDFRLALLGNVNAN